MDGQHPDRILDVGDFASVGLVAGRGRRGPRRRARPQPRGREAGLALGPVEVVAEEPASGVAPGPTLEFLRILVCLNTNLTPKKNCGPVRFDIWGTHPYTSGNPTRKAAQKGDVSLGDLPAVRKLLNAGLKHRKITAAGGKVKFWVDEFSWDTKPPDPAAIPAALHKRWVAEGMYRMWTSGVTMVAWLQLADNKYTGACGDPYQSGFYYFNSNIAQAKVKPSIVAFRFPFVAIPERTSLRIWGRTRMSDPGKVTIQRRTSSGWRKSRRDGALERHLRVALQDPMDERVDARGLQGEGLTGVRDQAVGRPVLQPVRAAAAGRRLLLAWTPG